MLASPRLASPRLASPRLASPRLASPRLASPRLALQHDEYVSVSEAGSDQSFNEQWIIDIENTLAKTRAMYIEHKKIEKEKGV